MNWKNTGRWLALPFAVVGVELLLTVLGLLFNFGDRIPEEHTLMLFLNGFIIYFWTHFIASLGAVGVGQAVAPSHKKQTAVVVGVLLCVVALCFLIALFVASSKDAIGKKELIKGVFSNIGRFVGSVAGIIVFTKNAY